MYLEGGILDFNQCYKIALLGDTQVGKSSIACRFVFRKFSWEYTSTIEDIYTKRITVDFENSELEILDTAGMEEFRMVK